MTINFEYQDEYSNGRWNKQTAICDSIKAMIEFYGLHEPGVKFRIVNIEK